MIPLKHHIPSVIRDELDSLGKPWTAEMGSKHIKVKLDGRLVVILPKGKKVNAEDTATVRANLNAIRNIRRTIRR